MLQRALLVFLVITLSGCALLRGPHSDNQSRATVTQSVVEYLFGDANATEMAVAEVAELQLPLRVGIALAPQQHHHSTQVSAASQAAEQALLEHIAAAVAAHDSIGRAVVLPSGALTPSGGFPEVEGLALWHGFDTLLLVSLDQRGFTDDTELALLDLTVVGAYFVPAHINQVATKLTATVVHVPSRRYLLSASEVAEAQRRTTLAETAQALRAMQDESLTRAGEGLVPALEAQVTLLRERIRSDQTMSIAKGGVDPWSLIALVFLLALAAHRAVAKPA